MVVLVDEPLDKPPRILQRQRHVRSKAVLLDRLMPTFDLAVGLRIVRRSLHMGHPCMNRWCLRPISSNEHLAAAQEIMDRLLAKGKLDRGEESCLDALSDLVASYEAQHFPIEPASEADR